MKRKGLSQKNFPSEAGVKKKGSRSSIAFLFMGSILLSLIFWAKGNLNQLRALLNRPFVYKITKTSDETLEADLGIKPDFTDLEGVRYSIELLLEGLQGEYGVYFYDMQAGQSLGVREEVVFQAASVNKIPIMVSFYQEVEKGRLKEESIYVLKEGDIQDYGAGSLRYQEPGTKYKYGELIELMGKESDNTAAYVISNLVGQSRIQKALDDLGMENTLLEENTTTAKEMGSYLVEMYQAKLVKEGYGEKMLEALSDTAFEDRLPRGVPGYIQVAHKTGNEVQVYNDCGIILSSNPYVLCVLSQGTVEDEALDVIAKISQLVWEFSKRSY